MKRARATELVLVNWKGVFFERYLLDSNVTALEGDNGAGKTTVMIAAYVVLLPDLSRLRFTNLGETGATGGDRGIWGRLGASARPSFAALTLRLGDGTPLIAGVHIKRKAQPTLELNPFIISKLPDGARARNFLLQISEEHDEIPTLDDVKRLTGEAGAKLEVFPTSKAYFSALFELGISPMRLSGEEERNKYNDMLRTSMTGGISRALTSELRSFVLKQETGLSNTLGRMRQSLAACRKTRTEVTESRELERQLSGVFEAGRSMFQAAMLATKVQADEQRGAEVEARRVLDEREAIVAELNLELKQVEREQSGIDARLSSIREQFANAQSHRHNLERALSTFQRLSTLLGEARETDERVALKSDEQRAASRARQHARDQRARAQAALLKSAQGLANLQAGLEDLHRRAHAYQRATQQLGKAQHALKEAGLEASALDRLQARNRGDEDVDTTTLLFELQQQIKEALETLDRTRAQRARETALSERHREEHGSASSALQSLGGNLAAGDRLSAARDVLSHWADQDLIAKGAPLWAQQLRELESKLHAHETARKRAAELGLEAHQMRGAWLQERISDLEVAAQAERERYRQNTFETREAAHKSEHLRGVLEHREHEKLAYRRLRAAQAELSQFPISSDTPESQFHAWRGELLSSVDTHSLKLVALASERERLLEQAAQLRAHGAAPSLELLRLCDAVGGELLARRFEDVPPEAARSIEARLGPLSEAIVVEDLEQAKAELMNQERELESVWLLRPGTNPLVSDAPESEAALDVAVPTEWGLRISRIPSAASLGRDAREQRIEHCSKQAQQLERDIQAQEQALANARSQLSQLDTIIGGLPTFRKGDPSELLTQLAAELDAEEQAANQARELARTAAQNADRLREEAQALRALLPDAASLDSGDLPEQLAQARRELKRAQTAAEQVEQHKAARHTLERLIDSLSETPASDEKLASWADEQALLEAKRDALFEASEAVSHVIAEQQALAYCDAVEALQLRSKLVPELEAQHEALEKQAEHTETEAQSSETRWEAATSSLQVVQAEQAALAAHVTRLQQELAEQGITDPSEQALAEASAQCQVLAEQQQAIELEARQLSAQGALAKERYQTALEAFEQARDGLAKRKHAREPAEQLWQSVRSQAEAAKISLPHPEVGARLSAQELWPEARTQRSLLLDRLTPPGRAEPVLGPREQFADESPLAYLGLWQEVRSFLAQRLPAQIANMPDPIQALQRLRHDLGSLERRLLQQENELKATSEDVGRSIDVLVRRAYSQVRRVNEYLADIKFGSIHGIRIKAGRVDKMAQVLEALRDGSAQNLLFQSTLPIEDALDEIFRRYGGGRGSGTRILDYREYIELSVEVQRKSDTANWEIANPTRVSTGEAIGVGAALMMVILAEWERDSRLLRANQTHGSLRFLFLDEANRLSQDNLGVLFELCRVLDLQLLIAAPEVAKSEGNTTYRLVRCVSEDGSEEVLVTGRRSKLPEAESKAPPAADMASTPEVQQALFSAKAELP